MGTVGFKSDARYVSHQGLSHDSVDLFHFDRFLSVLLIYGENGKGVT